MKELNKAIAYAKETSDLWLTYAPLGRATLHLRVYADAFFVPTTTFHPSCSKLYFSATGRTAAMS